jgi:hypothetical protein
MYYGNDSIFVLPVTFKLELKEDFEKLLVAENARRLHAGFSFHQPAQSPGVVAGEKKNFGGKYRLQNQPAMIKVRLPSHF